MERRRGKEEKGEGLWDWEGEEDRASGRLVMKRRRGEGEELENERKTEPVEGW